MDGGAVLDKENNNFKGDKMKGEEMVKGSTVVGNMPRKKLGDISNLPEKNQDIRPPSVSLNTKEYIHKLHQENLTLVKLLADRNKIIQSHAYELQKLRTQFQQLQQKNLELAQSNSQMLAELNSSKDRLKLLQHELGCKGGMIKAMTLEFEVDTLRHGEVGRSSQANIRDDELCNKRMKRQFKASDHTMVKPVQTKEKIDKNRKSARLKAGEQDLTDATIETTDDLNPPMVKPVEIEKKVDEKRLCSRRQSARFRAAEQETADASFHLKPAEQETADASFQLKPAEQEKADASFQMSDALDPTIAKPIQAEKKTDNKRFHERRQSARFKGQEQVQDPTEDSFQIDDAKFPVSPLYECDPTPSVSRVKSEPEAAHSASRSEDQELRRSSFRPKRQAAEKVQSYKEVPLNVKMRRTE